MAVQLAPHRLLVKWGWTRAVYLNAPAIQPHLWSRTKRCCNYKAYLWQSSANLCLSILKSYLNWFKIDSIAIYRKDLFTLNVHIPFPAEYWRDTWFHCTPPLLVVYISKHFRYSCRQRQFPSFSFQNAQNREKTRCWKLSADAPSFGYRWFYTSFLPHRHNHIGCCGAHGTDSTCITFDHNGRQVVLCPAYTTIRRYGYCLAILTLIHNIERSTTLILLISEVCSVSFASIEQFCRRDKKKEETKPIKKWGLLVLRICILYVYNNTTTHSCSLEEQQSFSWLDTF